MSKFADYHTLSRDYDVSRSAVSSDLYIGAFITKQRKPLQELHLLDAGCGTGNYAKAVLDAGIGRVTLFDANSGMLVKAKAKLDKYIEDGRIVDIRNHSLPILPFPEANFDIVMINNVIHHLDTESDFPNFKKSIGEIYRVLKPGGILAIQLCYPHQVLRGMWAFHLTPKALSKFTSRFVPPEMTKETLTNVGFKNIETVVPVDTLPYEKDVFFNLDGPLSADVLGSDSFWESVDPEELAAAKERVRTMKKNGTMEDFMKKNDAERHEVGHFSLLFALK